MMFTSSLHLATSLLTPLMVYYIHIKQERLMDFITDAILSGIIWDSIKSGVPLTLDYVKSKAQGYILDAPTLAKLEDLSKQLPAEAKESESSLASYIENNQEWKAVSKQIIKSKTFTQNITGENAKGVQADKIDTLNM